MDETPREAAWHRRWLTLAKEGGMAVLARDETSAALLKRMAEIEAEVPIPTAAPRPEGVEREDWKAKWDDLASKMRAWVAAWESYTDPNLEGHSGSPRESLEHRMDVLEEQIRRALTHQTQERALYYRRCGWCGAYEGTVDPDEPCRDATDPATGEIMGPHQFGVYEPARSRAVRTVKLAAPPQPTEEDDG